MTVWGSFVGALEFLFMLRRLRILLGDPELQKLWEFLGVFQEYFWKAYEHFSLIYPLLILLGIGEGFDTPETLYAFRGNPENP